MALAFRARWSAAARIRSPLLVALTLLCLVAGVAFADEAGAARLRVAVLDFDVNDLTGDVREPERLGRFMATEFEAPLVQSQRFTVLTRLDLEKVLEELALGASGVVNPEQARAFGALAGVDVIITGSITVLAEASFAVSARFIDVGTGEVGAAEALRTSGPEGFLELAERLVERVAARYPLRGSVFAVEGDEVAVDLGLVHGLAGAGEVGMVYRVRSIAGRRGLEPVGSFVVRQAFEDFALVEVALAEGASVSVGDVVVVEEVTPLAEEAIEEPDVAPPPGQEASDGVEAAADPEPAPEVEVEEPEPESDVAREVPEPALELEREEVQPAPEVPAPESEAPAMGVVRVVGSPTGADVVVGEEVAMALGAEGVDVSVAAGEAVVRVVAEGFVPFEGSVVVEAGAVVVVEVALESEPSLGQVVIDTVPEGARVFVDGVERGARFALAPGRYSVAVWADGYLEERFELLVPADGVVERRVVLRRFEATLVVDVVPEDAVVRVDGVVRSERELRLLPGVYQLAVEAEGLEPFERRVILVAGQEERLEVRLLPPSGVVVFDVVPEDAVVRVDGVVRPGREVTLPAGAHRLDVEAEGFEPYVGEVVVVGGARDVVQVALRAVPVPVVIETDPAGAVIVVDGVERSASFEIAPGEYEVVVRADGFAEERFTLVVMAGERVERRVELGSSVTVRLTPESVQLEEGASREFTASVSGAADAGVTWSASCGEISSLAGVGWFTAPDAPDGASSIECIVTATSVVETTASASARVRVAAVWAAAIENVSLAPATGGSRRVSFDISWPESWRGPSRPSWVAASDNWDAAWVFVKYRVDGGAWQHATLAGGGHVVPSGAVVDVPSDRVGAFIYRSSSGYGTFTANGVGLQWDYVADGVPAGASVEVWPFGIEMVYVPEGSFSVGSGGNSTGEFRAGGWTSTPFVVSSQSSIALGDGSGQLMWTASSYSGSPSGNTNASFPTGYGAFYVMKHQVTQGQYVDFLNTLTQTQANARKHSDDRHRYAITGESIGSYATSLPFVAMNHMSWADGAAFADWAGLRPMTELEFEKAARGPLSPVADEFAWGSTSITQATGLTNAGTISETPLPVGANAQYRNWEGSLRGPVRVGSFAAPGRSRRDAGAGYYGALELSGNLWERTVTVGNAEGRAFTGAHGDGALDGSGNANVASWPGSNAVGAGARGGDWDHIDGNLRVSNRRVAAIANAIRLSGNGWRGARSAP